MDTPTFLFIFIICLMGLIVVAIVGVFGGALLFTRRMAGQLHVVWEQAAAELGLHFDKSVFEMTGHLEGVAVKVDLVTSRELVVRVERARTRTKSWLRVQAQPPTAPTIEVFPRGAFKERPGMQVRPTGDAVFDEQFQLFVPVDEEVDAALPETVRQMMSAADVKVAIAEGAVTWVTSWGLRDPDRLAEAIRTCARAAAALQGL